MKLNEKLKLNSNIQNKMKTRNLRYGFLENANRKIISVLEKDQNKFISLDSNPDHTFIPSNVENFSNILNQMIKNNKSDFAPEIFRKETHKADINDLKLK